MSEDNNDQNNPTAGITLNPSQKTGDGNSTQASQPGADIPQPTQEELDAKLDQGPREIDVLKNQATAMGISFSPNIGVDTLKERIQAKQDELEAAQGLNEQTQVQNQDPNFQAPETTVLAPRSADPSRRTITDFPSDEEIMAMSTDDILRYPPQKRTQIIRVKQRKENLALIRCRIHNNNPAKNDLKGEIFSVSNRYLGVVRKFIPFGEATRNGYHIPKVLFENLRSRQYQRMSSVKNPDGTERAESTLAPEFTLEVLEPLTPEQLKDLANQQQARNASVGFVGA